MGRPRARARGNSPEEEWRTSARDIVANLALDYILIVVFGYGVAGAAAAALIAQMFEAVLLVNVK